MQFHGAHLSDQVGPTSFILCQGIDLACPGKKRPLGSMPIAPVYHFLSHLEFSLNWISQLKRLSCLYVCLSLTHSLSLIVLFFRCPLITFILVDVHGSSSDGEPDGVTLPQNLRSFSQFHVRHLRKVDTPEILTLTSNKA